MGSWLYAYLTRNQTCGPLDSVASLLAMASQALEPDSTAKELISDDEGHCEPAGRAFSLTGDTLSEASKLLARDKDIFLMLRNKELYFSCTFALKARRPYIAFGWSNRLFQDLDRARKSSCLHMIGEAAKRSGATSVIFVRDAPGYFEDRIEYVEDHLLLDAQLPNGRVAEVLEVWAEGVVMVEGLKLRPLQAIGVYTRNVAESGGLI